MGSTRASSFSRESKPWFNKSMGSTPVFFFFSSPGVQSPQRRATSPRVFLAAGLLKGYISRFETCCFFHQSKGRPPFTRCNVQKRVFSFSGFLVWWFIPNPWGSTPILCFFFESKAFGKPSWPTPRGFFSSLSSPKLQGIPAGPAPGGFPSRGFSERRILTASVFAFFAVASNDFALGFPAPGMR